MQLKGLLQDDDAVSPVIGVILMVAITVILAAVIATFVLGLGDRVSTTSPQASFSFEWNGSSSQDGLLEITHSGGDSIKAKELYVRGNAGTDNGDGDTPTLGSSWDNYDTTNNSYMANDDITAGNKLEVWDVSPDGDVLVVWERNQGDKSATLGTWEGPDA